MPSSGGTARTELASSVRADRRGPNSAVTWLTAGSALPSNRPVTGGHGDTPSPCECGVPGWRGYPDWHAPARSLFYLIGAV